MSMSTLSSTAAITLCALLAIPACTDDDDGTDAVGDDDTSTAGDEGSFDDGSKVDDDESGSDTSDDDTSDDEELMGCDAVVDEALCLDMLGCGAVYGNAVVEAEDGWCTEAEAQFIGCVVSAELCPALPKLACDSDNNVFQTDGCIPAMLDACVVEGEIQGPCAGGLKLTAG